MAVSPDEFPFNKDAPEATKRIWAEEETKRRAAHERGFDQTPRDGKKKLPNMPPRGSATEVCRAWLTYVLRPPEGWSYWSFWRYGTSRTDGCELEFISDEGSHVVFEVDEWRSLRGTGLRTEIIAVTNGACLPQPMSINEADDVLAMLLLTMKQAQKSNTRDNTLDWIGQFREYATRLEGHTLLPQGRIEALDHLQEYDRFGKQDIRALNTEDATFAARPVILEDHLTGDSWCRVSEFAVYVRDMIGVPNISWDRLKSCICAVGGDQVRFQAHIPGGRHIIANLYRLPREGDE